MLIAPAQLSLVGCADRIAGSAINKKTAKVGRNRNLDLIVWIWLLQDLDYYYFLFVKIVGTSDEDIKGKYL